MGGEVYRRWALKGQAVDRLEVFGGEVDEAVEEVVFSAFQAMVFSAISAKRVSSMPISVSG